MRKHIASIVPFVLLLTATAAGQGDDAQTGRRRITPQLALALVTVSEEGWLSCESDVCDDAGMRAIHAVLANGAQRHSVSYVSYAGWYARGVIGRQREIGRPWLWGLRPDGAEPTHWPAHVFRGGRRVPHPPWSAYRARWLRTYEHAGSVARLRLDDWSSWGPCNAIPTDWGGTMDQERAERLRMAALSCEGTRNTFYIRRSLIPEED